MRIFNKKNVYDAALDRIRWLFDEFPNVVCSFSGGKDSTVCFNLCMIVAKEKNRLPLSVIFIDQEAEWEATIDQVKEIMYNPDVKPYWFQIPIKLFNATSVTENWLDCWNPEKKDLWMHEMDPISIRENKYGTVRFQHLFDKIMEIEFNGIKSCNISGVRTEESPGRALGLTSGLTYKSVTWGKVISSKNGHYVFCPIYDWSYTDVWKAIHENKWAYCEIYNLMYKYGIPTMKMRVSNVHHETAVGSLFFMQEVEPQTYAKLTQRISGIDMASHMGPENYWGSKDVPFMFANRKEYRDYLLEKLITNEDWTQRFKRTFNYQEEVFCNTVLEELMYKIHIASILTNDWEGIKLRNFACSPQSIPFTKLASARSKMKKELENA